MNNAREVAMAKYKRILLKVSGEAFAGADGRGIVGEKADSVAKQIKSIVDAGVQVGVVVGGGNFWRGRTSENMDRVCADQIGMLATVMNALALTDALKFNGISAKMFSAVTIDKVALPYVVADARKCMDEGGVAVFGGGTGSPFFSTDTAVVLRACEMGAEALFCSKAVDGIYDCDPKQFPAAKKFDEISYDKVITDNLKALDLTATALAREYNLPIICFAKDEKDAVLRILRGEKLGTIVR